MKIKIEIETDSDAFEDDPNMETAQILRELADKIEAGKMPTWLADSNGNTVGAVRTEY
jgi:hypothetical protein